jgi:hypothetical protein
MKALSILQPWSDAILIGAKRVENRTWRCGYRGELLIHAGKKFDSEGMGFLMDRYHGLGLALARPLLSSAPGRRGVLLGVVTMTGCIREDEVPEDQAAWAFGPWCFVFENPRPFAQPIPWKGERGIFEVSDDLFHPLSAPVSDSK